MISFVDTKWNDKLKLITKSMIKLKLCEFDQICHF